RGRLEQELLHGGVIEREPACTLGRGLDEVARYERRRSTAEEDVPAAELAPAPRREELMDPEPLRLGDTPGGERLATDAVAEEPDHSPTRALAKEVGELDRRPGVGRSPVGHVARPGDHRRHREELHHDVDRAEEEPLLPFHLGLVDGHAVEALARQLARAPLDEAEMPRERAEIAVGERRPEPAQPE